MGRKVWYTPPDDVNEHAAALLSEAAKRIGDAGLSVVNDGQNGSRAWFNASDGQREFNVQIMWEKGQYLLRMKWDTYDFSNFTEGAKGAQWSRLIGKLKAKFAEEAQRAEDNRKWREENDAKEAAALALSTVGAAAISAAEAKYGKLPGKWGNFRGMDTIYGSTDVRVETNIPPELVDSFMAWASEHGLTTKEGETDD